MIRVAIVDNEKKEIENLRALFQRYSRENEISFDIVSFESGITFLEEYRMERFELVFMDVDMPDMDGFETSRRLRKVDSSVALVFVTNVSRMAIRGYEVGAMDYLLKPMSYEAFRLKMPRIFAQCQRNEKEKIVVKTKTGQHVFDAGSIVYVASDGHRIIYHTEMGDFPAYGTMKEIEQQLYSERFFRCNSGYIVNLSFVTGCSGNMLELRGGSQIEISRARRKEFLEALQRYCLFLGGR